MAGKDRWGSVFSKAKDWVEKKVEETTTSDNRKSERLASEADDLERAMKEEAQMNAVRQAVPGLDRALDHQEERKQAGIAERDAKLRDTRVAAFRESSWVQVTGAMSGRVEGLAARVEVWDTTEQIVLEPIDPVALNGGTFELLSFVVPRNLAVGSHDLADNYTDSEGFELYVDTGESYYWAPDYGTARVTLNSNGSLRFELAMENAGSDHIAVSGLVGPA